MSTILESLGQRDAGRDPRRLAIKYEKMTGSAFAFFRGTCHRFYEQLPIEGPTRDAPPAWICGDLHFENFGSFRGDNRLVYFDLNDFDEACLAPVTWDLVRFQTSLLLGARALHVEPTRAARLARTWLERYAAALRSGKPQWIERATARGMVKRLLDSLKKRSQREFLDARAPRRGKRRRIAVCGETGDEIKALPPAGDGEAVLKAVERLARRTRREKELRPLGVADRVAGTGSLGLERRVILVRGEGGKKDKNWLLDAKAPPPSAPARQSPCGQPAWPSEADRVVTLQGRLQAVSPALLAPLEIGGTWHVLRELLPSEDRVEFAKAKGTRLETALKDMAHVVAWAHLRGAGRQGSATVDDLVAFGAGSSWRAPLLEMAADAARGAEADHAVFAGAHRDGAFERETQALRGACR